jgi:hypothetical protein
VCQRTDPGSALDYAGSHTATVRAVGRNESAKTNREEDRAMMKAMMNVDKRWLVAIALSAAAGAAVAAQLLRRRHRSVQHHDHHEDLKAWENEGGNLAPPVPAAAASAHR